MESSEQPEVGELHSGPAPFSRFRLPRLTLSRRFGIVALLVVPLLASVCVVGGVGVRKMNTEIEGLYDNQYRQTLAYSQLRRSLGAAETATLRLIQTNSPRLQAELKTRLDRRLLPKVDLALRGLRSTAQSSEEDEARDYRKLAASWRSFERVLRSDAFDLTRLTGDFEAADDRLAARITALLDGLLGQADGLVSEEATEAREHRDQAQSQYRSTLGLLLGASVLALLGTLAVIAWLIRGVVPRARDYSQFASAVAQRENRGASRARGARRADRARGAVERNGLSARERTAADRPAGRVQRGDADQRERARGLPAA